MRLVTFQPLKVLQDIDTKGKYTHESKDERLGNKIFCLKVDENTMENIFITAPSMPQVLIEFEVDDSEIESLDYIEWVNYLNNNRRTYKGKYATVAKYKEYAVTSIDASNVIHREILTDITNPDVVQDIFMDKHFDRYEKLSDHKWKRNRDLDSSGFWQTPKAYELIQKVTRCMMPMQTLTEQDVDEAHKIIREVYLLD